MTVVFDKLNAISFFKQVSEYNIGEDIIKLLKRQLNLQFNFQLDDIDEALEFQILEFIETGGRTDAGLSIIFKDGKDYKEPFCFESLLNNNNIFLLEKITPKIKNSNKVLIGEIGEEIEVLKKLFLFENDSSLQENILIGSELFKSWEDIDKYQRPFSSIVIVDRYMFKGPELGGNIDLFEYNLKEILATLFKKINHRTNLTFIFQINPFALRTSQNFDEGPDLKKLKSKVKNAVKLHNKYCPEPIMNFIAVPKGKIDDEHDRFIITNYIRIKSGDSLVYFDSNNNIISKSNEFDIYSAARKQYRDSAKNLEVKLNNIVNETLSKFKSRSLLNDDDKFVDLIYF
jgi:hypothetical protein